MLLATILLLGALPQSGELARPVADAPAAVLVADAGKDSGAAGELPSMPKAKAKADADGVATTGNAAAETNPTSAGSVKVSANAAMEPAAGALPFQPMKPAYTRPRETRGQRICWYTLAAASHGAAAFDAYSTRRAVSGNFGVESNPLLRPFSHSSALYAATQVSPVVMDYIGKRMMVSVSRWVRKMWWLPQMAGSGFSVAAGVHNMSVVR
jgi:hypothetical protein